MLGENPRATYQHPNTSKGTRPNNGLVEIYRKRHRKTKASLKVLVNGTLDTLTMAIVHVPSPNPIGTCKAQCDGVQLRAMMDVCGQG